MNKSFYEKLSLSVIALIGVSQVTLASAEQRIATVDMQKALQTVKSGRDAKAQLEKEINQKKAEIQKEETAMQKMQDEMQKQALVMNEEARAKKANEFQKRYLKLQQMANQSHEEITQKEQKLTQPIIDKMSNIIHDLAEKGKYSLVLEKNKTMVLFSEEKDDLTKKVIEQFDKQ